MTTSKLFMSKMPPRIEEVKIYFNQKGIGEREAEAFFLFYEKRNWMSKKGNLFRNWKSIAYRWVTSVLYNQPHLFNRKVH